MNKIKEAIEQSHVGRYEIPGVTRGDLPEFFKEMGYKVGIEIGTYKGEFCRKFCEVGLKMYTVDPYLAYEDYDEKEGKFQERQDFLYNLAQENLKGYDAIIIRKTSMEAVKDFENESLDFVYIDGHHSFKYVAEDLWEWSKKVKKGGVISGHDYGIPTDKRHIGPYAIHTRYVIDAYVQALGIKSWYVLGAKGKIEGVRRDIWRSWMWVKE